MKETIIEVSKLSFQYRGEQDYALEDVSFEVYKGEWLAIVGHNGSGKSTLARLLNGLLLPKEGIINVNGVLLQEDTVWDIRKMIGMVFQNPDNQFVGTTVIDDVAFGMENHGIDREIMVKRADEALSIVKMDEFRFNEPHNLSGGQKQRVAIAGVIAIQPNIIILDEATSMLDPNGRQEVLDTVRTLKDDKNITVISITHDLEEAARADRIIVMNKGKKFQEGTPSEIFELHDTLQAIGLDIPFPVKLSKAFKDIGVPISSNHITEEDLVNDLCQLYLKM
ncbi:energy-coupling factor ABC transporter ATP-binding protein [Bacillus sp. HMF5848]|uniref:energy-coupling factor ABC transporter ATP-binding protein n=1 Tax=Bacillus sp. HMF5848 TaxID=2495421 RepID=UPI000F77070F|nr:energy-coupling factor ABC transporter ATP-binding protein [Bacillus sp. HMF5848]RSK25576.1 energy-coupling factor ABC transporter ATP-binding protein [Bacillus sp. HMF5848]